MILFSFYVREDQLTALRAKAASEGAPIAFQIRRGIDWVLGSGLVTSGLSFNGEGVFSGRVLGDAK